MAVAVAKCPAALGAVSTRCHRFVQIVVALSLASMISWMASTCQMQARSIMVTIVSMSAVRFLPAFHVHKLRVFVVVAVVVAVSSLPVGSVA